MKLFIQEIVADIDWRTGELSSIKAIPIQYSFSREHKDIHLKYSVPAIYSIWEGFVRNCFDKYANHLNSLNLQRSDIALELLTLQLDSACKFGDSRKNFESKMRLTEELNSLLQNRIEIKPNVPTESNVKFKVLNSILEKYCIQPLTNSNYEKGLNRLLMFRNKIAHGENSIIVTQQDINQFIDLIENLMLDVVIEVESHELSETYKK